MDKVSSTPKYSIVIPTRNRQKYLRYAVESVLSDQRADVELIISNNHSADDTEAYLATISDPRVKIVRPTAEISMSSHYEFALSQAKGEWVTIIGDDDSVMPYLFDSLDVLVAQYPQTSIISSERAYYFWDGCQDLYGDLVVVYRSGPRQEMRSTKRDLFAALSGARSCFDLPQIYTSCIVRRSLVERIKSKSDGRFYHSIIPDMYSAVSLSLAEDFYLRVEEPLFWTGTSNASMGRSDRIYKDSDLSSSSDLNATAPMRLHSRVAQELHILGIGSLYLYEALLCCPYATAWRLNRTIPRLVYADVLRKLSGKVPGSGDERLNAEAALWMAIELEGLSKTGVKVTKLILEIVDIFRWVLNLPRRISNRIRRMFVKSVLFSTDRSQYGAISDASKEVAMLRSNV